MFRTKFAEKIKRQFMFNNFFFRKSCCLWDNLEKWDRARQATDDNIIRRMHIACWVTKATDNTLGICNTYCFSTAIMVTRTLLSVNVYTTLPVLYYKKFCKVYSDVITGRIKFRITAWYATFFILRVCLGDGGTDIRPRLLAFLFPSGGKFCLFSRASIRILRPAPSSTQYVTGAVSPGSKPVGTWSWPLICM
jgi:hypothetical protein